MKFSKPPAASPSSGRAKLIAFLNTTLGLFLLSSVFISGFTWAYTQFSELRKASETKASKRKNLHLEINHRLRVISKMTHRFPHSELNIIRTAAFGFKLGATQNPSHLLYYSGIIDEYNARSIESLLVELESLESDDKKQAIKRVRLNCFGLTEYFDRLIPIVLAVPVSADGSGKLYYYELPADLKKQLVETLLTSPVFPLSD